MRTLIRFNALRALIGTLAAVCMPPLNAFALDSPVGLAVSGDIGHADNPGGSTQVFSPPLTYWAEQSQPVYSGDLTGNIHENWHDSATPHASASASSRAFFGDLGVYASAWVGDAPSNVWWQANATATATFNDVWHVDAGIANGSVGWLSVTVALDGSHTASPDNSQTLRLNLYNNYGIGFNSDSLTDKWSGVFVLNVPFKFGPSFNNNMSMQLIGGAGAHNDSGGPSTSSLVDFYNSAKITDLSFSSNGAEITSYTLTADSGHIYASVPEPETWAMLLAGLGLLGLKTHRASAVEGTSMG